MTPEQWADYAVENATAFKSLRAAIADAVERARETRRNVMLFLAGRLRQRATA